MGEVTGIDTEPKHVRVAGLPDVPYDDLAAATGSVHSWFGHDGWAGHAHVLKTLVQALALRASRRARLACGAPSTSSS